jgi:hypothetical protein
MVLGEFSEKVLQGFVDGAKSRAARGRGSIRTAKLSIRALARRAQQVHAFHSTERWVKRAGAEAIAVAREFLERPEAQERRVTHMMQYPRANESGRKRAGLAQLALNAGDSRIAIIIPDISPCIRV